MEELSRTASALALQLSDIRVKAVTGESSLAEITMRLSQLTESSALRSAQNEKTQLELEECRSAHKLCCGKVEELQNAARGYEMRFQSRRAKLETARQTADQLGLDVEEKVRRARLLEELERSMEGFAHSVKAVMKQAERGALRGIRGRCRG